MFSQGQHDLLLGLSGGHSTQSRAWHPGCGLSKWPAMVPSVPTGLEPGPPTPSLQACLVSFLCKLFRLQLEDSEKLRRLLPSLIPP